MFSQDWETLWKEHTTPWDIGSPTPILQSELPKIPKGRALVPGCGSGYDVFLLADVDREVVGLDLSSTSITRSQKLLDESSIYKHKDKVSLVCGDFFTADIGKFNFIYDYTFFCALPMSLRSAWGKRMAELLGPNGKMLTIIYPIDNELASKYDSAGPPFPVSLDEYKKALVDFELTDSYVSDLTIKPRKGREMIAWWSKK